MQYSILADGDTVATRSNKGKAVELAEAHRNEHKVAVSVVTDKNTEVFSLAAPKKINMSPRFSRDKRDELPEGVEAPAEVRVAYVRPRAKLAVLHREGEDIDPDKAYSLLDFSQGSGKERAARYSTTRQAGDAMTAIAAQRKAKAAQAEVEAPANA